MTNLKARLQQLRSQAGAQQPISARDEQTNSRTSLKSKLETIPTERLLGPHSTGNSKRGTKQLADTLNGTLLDNGIILIEQTIKLGGHLGNINLGTLGLPSKLPGEFEQSGRYIYIDTETTGLSGGSGTLAFLIGSASLSGQTLLLTQYLLTSFIGESDLLSTFINKLAPEDILVSYNGKSYDVPLLASRLKMQSIHYPIDTHAHVDLLHPMRRLFKKKWLDCRLTTVEQNLIGFTRKGDLPGSEAPEAWFSYIRQQQSKRLTQVVKHNRQDLISLVVAHITLGRAVNDPVQYRVPIYPLARWLAKQDESEAIALLSAHEQALCTEGRQYLARLYRRKGCWKHAVFIWGKLAQRGCAESTEHLAKYYEHISKDYPRAIYYCNKLPGSAEDLHRKRRIERRIASTQALARDTISDSRFVLL